MGTRIGRLAYLKSWHSEALQEKAGLSFDIHIWGIGGA